MTVGTHTLEITTFVQDGGLLESARSAALRVTVSGGAAAPSDSTASAHPTSAHTTVSHSTAAAWPATAIRLASGLDRPTDLAFLPDGALLIAERSGSVRVARGGLLTDAPALVLSSEVTGGDAVLALAVDSTQLIPGAQNAELKSLLQTGLKLFQSHQQHAEHLAASLK